MTTPLRLLIVEDSEDDTNLLLHALKKGGYDPIQYERVDSGPTMEVALARQKWDVVVADHNLPRFSSTAALDLLKDNGYDIPFFIVSGSIDEDLAAQAMKAGAQDYVMKDNLTRLCPAIARELREVEVRRDRERAEATVEHQAHYDLLTNLPNRNTFHDRLTVALAQAGRNRKMLAVLFVDLDRFKTIVDTLGHTIGDQLLRSVAERLGASLEAGDTLARLGGDEFVILLPQINRADRAVRVAQRVLEAIKPPFLFDSHELHVTMSIGITLYPYDGEDADTLLKNADTALYRAKEQGRNNYQLYTPAMNARAFERLALENSLRKALERNEFSLYYQPQVHMLTGAIVGIEAVLRWQHPDLGIVYPSEFISIAEETGLIGPLGEWVIRTACVQNQDWQKMGLPPMTMAVNLSARQFQQQDLVQNVARILKETDLDPRWLEMEITEGIAMQNADYTNVLLRGLKDMGVRVALDDFGTGYSSLSYLKKFPIDTLKIDQSFVRDLIIDPNDAAIANAVIVLAHSLKLKVVAEGVETREQEAFLREHQCDTYQGFLFSNPLPADSFEMLLRKHLQKIA
jgi:diguanylate cyclase (GGDEF)-like protein